MEVAIFGGGCFWNTEAVFENLPGVKSAVNGYMGGKETDPTYKNVMDGKNGHVQVTRVTFDPRVVHYKSLLKLYWRNIDPTSINRQFNDIGSQYRTVILYTSNVQRKAAIESKKELIESQKFTSSIVTEIRSASEFHEAEPEHQNYMKKNPIKYKYYHISSGRLRSLKQIWR